MSPSSGDQPMAGINDPGGSEPTSGSVDVQALLDQFQPLFNQVHERYGYWSALQGIDRAVAAYQTRLKDLNDRLEVLRKRKAEIEHQRQRLRMAELLSRAPMINIPRPGRRPGPGEPVSLNPPPEPSRPPPPIPPRLLDARGAGIRLKKLVGRYQFVCRLDAELVGRINSIVDDEKRPLGEALALMEWSAIQELLGVLRTPQEQRARLDEWILALQEYRTELEEQISIYETRYRSWLGIWKTWLECESSAPGSAQEGMACWEDFILQTRKDLTTEIARLEKELPPAPSSDQPQGGEIANGGQP